MRILLRLGMTTKQKKYRLSLLKQIHMHPEYKRLFANGEWVGWLEAMWNTTSSKYLRIDQLIDTLAFLNGANPHFIVPSTPTSPTPNQIKRVHFYCKELDWNLKKLEEFCLHVCKKPSRHFNKEDTTKLLIGLGKVYAAVFKNKEIAINDPNYIPSWLQ
ncbi:hypothetical protein [Helicobacter suis]|uniref:hypothetical protein n=2 Tax=Helicobacter suis TaxID=104628 RepID=UPI0013D37AD1|nr:hypothetical protein [Helicobacter suis]